MRSSPISMARLAGLLTSTCRASRTAGMPFKATVAITYRCPCRCQYCGLYERVEEEMPRQTLVGALASVPSITWLDLTGGEVLLRTDLLEVAHDIVDVLPNLALFHFPTSGCSPTAAVELARSIAARGVKVVVSVSIEGPQDVHDSVRGLPGSFGSAVQTLNSLKQIPGVSSYVGTTIIPQNCELVPHGLFHAVQEHVPGLKPSDIHVNVMQGSGHYFNNAVAPRPGPEELARALRRTIRFKGFPAGPFAALELLFQSVALQANRGRWGVVPRCSAGDASFFLSPSGIVYPCHIWAEPIGRLSEDGSNLAALLLSERAAWLRKSISLRHCPLCWTPCEAYPTIISRAMNPG